MLLNGSTASKYLVTGLDWINKIKTAAVSLTGV